MLRSRLVGALFGRGHVRLRAVGISQNVVWGNDIRLVPRRSKQRRWWTSEPYRILSFFHLPTNEWMDWWLSDWDRVTVEGCGDLFGFFHVSICISIASCDYSFIHVYIFLLFLSDVGGFSPGRTGELHTPPPRQVKAYCSGSSSRWGPDDCGTGQGASICCCWPHIWFAIASISIADAKFRI